MSKNIIIIAIIIFGIIAFICGYLAGKEEVMNWAIEEQQKTEERHLATLQEFTANYNELYQEYNNLYQNYLDEKIISWDTFTVTAYTQYDEGCNNITSIGLDYEDSWTEYFNFCATDPTVIPYGSIVFIKLTTGEILQCLVVDCGENIKGKRIDLFVSSKEEAFEFGIQALPVGVVK